MPVFDDTLKTALNVSLRQSPFLNVLSDSDVAETLQLMTRPANTTLTSEMTRELCLRAGSKAYLAGSIGSLGSEYVLAIEGGELPERGYTGTGAGDGGVEGEGARCAGRGSIQAAWRTGRVVGHSAEVRCSARTGNHFLTRSSESIQPWHEGSNEKGPAAALPYDQRAIQLDPNFAMGYSAVGRDYFNLAELGRASEYITKAFQLREHVSEREKLSITAIYYRERNRRTG